MAKSNGSTVRILISLPRSLADFLNDAKRTGEIRTTSGYIQDLLRRDREALLGAGWRPAMGWKYRETPAYRKYLAEAGARAGKVVEKQILVAARRIKDRRAAKGRTS